MKKIIAESDVFQLYWSESAAKSNWVAGEVTCACGFTGPGGEKGDGFIRPLTWVDDPPPLPEQIKHIHCHHVRLSKLNVKRYIRHQRLLEGPVASSEKKIDLSKYAQDKMFPHIDGIVSATIVAADGTYLGKISRIRLHEADSIINTSGEYGRWGAKSINNPHCIYGSREGKYSPYNPSGEPPRILLKGHFIGYLTLNKDFRPRYDPDAVLDWLKANAI